MKRNMEVIKLRLEFHGYTDTTAALDIAWLVAENERLQAQQDIRLESLLQAASTAQMEVPAH